MKFTFVCVLLGEKKKEKYIASLNSTLVKAGDHDFPRPRVGTRKSDIFFTRPLAEFQFDMLALQKHFR
jgi:hypothetical protein